LEAKLGRKGLDDLEARATTHKWTQEELVKLREYYKDKIKAIERGEDPREHSAPEDFWKQ
jgi:hypothetical protein